MTLLDAMYYDKYNNVHKIIIVCKSLKTEVIIYMGMMGNSTNPIKQNSCIIKNTFVGGTIQTNLIENDL